MNIIECNKISLSYGVKEIIKDISFFLNESGKLGVIGVNGAGKSTLLHIIEGSVVPTSGTVSIAKGKTIGFLSQNTDTDFNGKTVLDYVLEPFENLLALEREIERLSGSLDIIENADRLADIRNNYILNGGNEYNTKVRSVLSRFSFEPDKYSFPADRLSGGQRTRLALAALILKDPDIFVLDEPTNHLDIGAVEWLEKFITESKKTFIIVSHDRYFLDRVTKETLEIENLTAQKYTGSYSEYKEKKKKLLDIQQKHYELQQKEIKRLEAFIENQRKWNRERNIIAAESRQKAIDRMVKIDKPKASPKTISIDLKTTSASRDVLFVRSLKKAFGENVLFEELSFDIHNGERVFIIGPNGCGKSTLMKILNGRMAADSGIYEMGYSQSVGYYDQEIQMLDPACTVIDELLRTDDELNPGGCRKLLAAYGFFGDDVFKKVDILSGGEKARLSIAKLILKKVSFLMLDEPTNHLDIPSKEILEEALAGFNGTVLCVSHDRYFINRLAGRIIEIDRNRYNDGYFDFKGGYDEFSDARNNMDIYTDDSSKSKSAGRDEYERIKKDRADQRSRQKRYEYINKKINEIEAELKLLDAKAAENASDYIMIDKIYKNQEELGQELDRFLEELLILEDELK